MAIKFVLMVNKQGQTRLAQYYETLTLQEKNAIEGEIIRKCLARTESQCSFIEYQNYKCVYRRYASLFFIIGVDSEENELSILEFIHAFVETLDKYFENVCELDVSILVPGYLCHFHYPCSYSCASLQIMFNIERAHFILNEMVMNGNIIECNKSNILKPILIMDKYVSQNK
jgi:AP-4 complex subunit sigma-1